MQKVKLPPSAMDNWLFLHQRNGTRTYRPADEDIFLKSESKLKFEDDIFVVPCSAIEVSLTWLEVDILKVELRVTLFLSYGGKSIYSEIIWDFSKDPDDPKCVLTCLDGRKPFTLEDDPRELLLDRLLMLLSSFHCHFGSSS